MVNLKYLVFLICFVQTPHYSVADNLVQLVDSVPDRLITDCFFGVETISFILYTRDIEDGVVLTVENITSTDEFKKHVLSRPIVFLIHGFMSAPNNSNYIDLAEAILLKDDVFVISIDWREGACAGGLSLTELAGYSKAAENTHVVGQYIANLTKMLIDKYDAKLPNMLVIGHSLGAQVAGFAGKEFQKLNVGKYPQIIGLDPAGPLFSDKTCSERLCITDAYYLQIIHTTMTAGVTEAIGHVDFYMNKGHLQPGCNPLDISCSHTKAVIYLTETIRHKCCFIGTPWSNYLITEPISMCTKYSCVCVGLNARDYPARGKFYVEVERSSPHCNSHNLIL
ncbi:hypothetical protein KPH14_003198 [Odynerus spinipes]|uniref:phospholipase A1 n=1 Tax=Odynerus spinipes TaxID=1348599 RepID=A0AAD9RXU9_9HYME|nr:hypothetical protein KPH14_003198 [Odynerus spinipes]